jgi:hypothetical protein
MMLDFICGKENGETITEERTDTEPQQKDEPTRSPQGETTSKSTQPIPGV